MDEYVAKETYNGNDFDNLDSLELAAQNSYAQYLNHTLYFKHHKEQYYVYEIGRCDRCVDNIKNGNRSSPLYRNQEQLHYEVSKKEGAELNVQRTKDDIENLLREKMKTTERITYLTENIERLEKQKTMGLPRRHLMVMASTFPRDNLIQRKQRRTERNSSPPQPLHSSPAGPSAATPKRSRNADIDSDNILIRKRQKQASKKI
jgi:hypothetical protein